LGTFRAFFGYFRCLLPEYSRSFKLRQAVDSLLSGGVIACPTEAVWGLTCDPQNPEAVERLLALKGRSVEKGLILVAADIADFDWLLTGLPGTQTHKLVLSWPGPTTWLVPHRGLVPFWIHGDHESVAVRVTPHPLLRALCRAWGGALVSTSANPSGSRAPTSGYQVRRYFGDRLDFLLPGATGGASRPSVIRDLLSDQVIRA
jgi:L-threonylcarbamoyladenylate synthase